MPGTTGRWRFQAGQTHLVIALARRAVGHELGAFLLRDAHLQGQGEGKGRGRREGEGARTQRDDESARGKGKG